MKYFILVVFISIVGCGYFPHMGDSFIWDDIVVKYDFNRAGDLAVVAFNHDSTIKYSASETPPHEYNNFFSVSLYDSTGKEVKSLIKKWRHSCFKLQYLNDSIILLGVTSDQFEMKDNTCIIKYNIVSGVADTVMQDSRGINSIEESSTFSFSMSENSEFIVIDYSTLCDHDNGVYVFDKILNSITSRYTLFENGAKKVFWSSDSIFLIYSQDYRTKIWSKRLYEVSNVDSTLEIKEIDISNDTSEYTNIREEVLLKEAHSISYIDDSLLFEMQLLEGL